MKIVRWGEEMGKLVLIDGNSIASRAFYALPLLTNKKGQYTNAAYGFTQMVIKILDDIKPEYMLVAFDAGKINFRHEDYAEYKGKREKTPSELSGQYPLIKNVLDAFDIKYFELVGYEADDIIGTIAKMSEENDIETIIYSGDKDMLQLASENVLIYLTRKGITEVEAYGPKEIMDKYELTPTQIIDLKGLMGDSSDNIPGVPGVGEKTALKLLREFKTIEAVLENIENIKGNKLKENLANNKEQAILSKQLATIFKQVPMELSLESLKYNVYDPKKLYEEFSNLEFNTLIERLKIDQTATEISNEFNDDIKEINITLYDKENIQSWNKLLQSGLPLALFLESDIADHQYKIHGLSISNGTEQIFITEKQLKEWTELVEWLKTPTSPKYVYDSKKTELALYWNDFALSGVTFDLMLGAYILNPSDGVIELSDIATVNGLDGPKSDNTVYGKGAKRTIPNNYTLAEHLCRKSNAIYNLTPMIEEHLKKGNLIELLEKIELPLSEVLSLIEKTGVSIDKERLIKMGEELNDRLGELTREIHHLAGEKFNINSPKQLGDILFNKLQLPIIKKTKTGSSTSADVLEKLEQHHPIISHILLYRQLGKLHSTYIEGLLKVINPKTNKIHTSFNQAITATGRLSSTEPNLQNIPIRLEEGRKIRAAFIPSEADWKILAADYSQIELRVLAHIANDSKLIEAFEQDMDIHTKTAMDVFGVAEAEVTSLMRRQAKAVNFGIVYGISDYGLSQNLNISRKEAAQFIETYFSIYTGVKEYMKEIVKTAKQDGYVSTLLNRRRYLPDINHPNFNIRSFAERTAMNTPIQGTAADIIKIAMVNIARIIKEENLKSRLLLQVHDELIFEVPHDELEQMKIIVKETMEGAIELVVPLKIDINIGDTWYEAK